MGRLECCKSLLRYAQTARGSVRSAKRAATHSDEKELARSLFRAV